MPLLPPARFAELHLEVIAATRPVSALESWFAAEVTYATWELERVRANAAIEPAEPRLNAAHSRATRNWSRARKELAALQSARTSHATRLSPGRQALATATPLADASRVPMPKLAGPILDHALDLVQSGGIAPHSLRIVNEQEAR
jgi:hypothetical protein